MQQQKKIIHGIHTYAVYSLVWDQHGLFDLS